MAKLKEAISGSIRMARYRARQSIAATETAKTMLQCGNQNSQNLLKADNFDLNSQSKFIDDERLHDEENYDMMGVCERTNSDEDDLILH